MEVAKSHQDSLSRIKQNVHRAYDYFKPNYDRYNEYRRFVFEATLKQEDVTLLTVMGRPQLEFNILEAYISRLLGEFSKQEPDIKVSADDENQADPLTIKVLEQHLRHLFSDSENHHTRYEVYKDVLSGGFSTLKVCTDYANSMSFNQVIKIERAFDPTLCGFDQLARDPHKGDGRFCFELFPMAKEDFEEDYPDIDLAEVNFRRDFSGFNWSYLNDATPIIMLCDYYEKKKRRVKIIKTADGKTMKMKEYKKMVEEWGDLTVPPAIVGEPRMTDIDYICRYRLIENQVLEYVETDFTYLPLIFVDGNSAIIKTPKNGNVRQVTRPYIYHAKDAQRLKNFAGIALANEIENTVQHKFMVAKEALPKEADYQAAYEDVQKASVLVFNSVYEGDPDQPINNPIREIHRDPAPPEMLQAFQGADSLIQNVLGSYDASLGINNNQLSGLAIVEAASQSNATAMPYIVGLLQGYQRAAQIYIDLFPKYYTTPRTVPVMDEEGKKSYVKINTQQQAGQMQGQPQMPGQQVAQPGQMQQPQQPPQMPMFQQGQPQQQAQQQTVNMFYDANALNVIVKAGASFQVQKSRTIMMVKEMMGMSPLFAQFIAEKGLGFVLDNMEGKGIEQLKSMVASWTQQMEQQKQMAMQMQQQQMQNDPAMLKVRNEQMKLQQDAQKGQQQFAVDMAKLQADQEKVMSDVQSNKETNLVQIIKANTERFAKDIELQMAHRDQRHRHLKEAIETYHKVNSNKEGNKHGNLYQP